MAAKDLSGVTNLVFDVYASRTGSNLKFAIHDTGGTTTDITPNITSANTWQTIDWDISAVSDANKNAVDTFVITVVNADAANTFYVDNFITVVSASVSPATFELAATLQTAGIVISCSITSTQGVLNLSLHSPTITVSSSVSPAAQALVLTQGTSTYIGSANVSLGALSLALTLSDIIASTSVSFTADAQEMVLAFNDPTLKGVWGFISKTDDTWTKQSKATDTWTKNTKTTDTWTKN